MDDRPELDRLVTDLNRSATGQPPDHQRFEHWIAMLNCRVCWPGRWPPRVVATVAALLAASVIASAQAPPRPRVAILTTGGTIASRFGAAMQDGNTLVGAVPQLLEHAAITVEEVTRVGSSQITPAHWMTLATRINTLFRDDRALAGMVVTHGTDTRTPRSSCT